MLYYRCITPFLGFITISGSIDRDSLWLCVVCDGMRRHLISTGRRCGEVGLHRGGDKEGGVFPPCCEACCRSNTFIIIIYYSWNGSRAEIIIVIVARSARFFSKPQPLDPTPQALNALNPQPEL